MGPRNDRTVEPQSGLPQTAADSEFETQGRAEHRGMAARPAPDGRNAPEREPAAVTAGREKSVGEALSGEDTEALPDAAVHDRTPGRLLLHLAVAGAVIGVVSAFVLVGSDDAMLRVAAMCLTFFAGGMAVFRLYADDKFRDAAALAAQDDEIGMAPPVLHRVVSFSQSF